MYCITDHFLVHFNFADFYEHAKLNCRGNVKSIKKVLNKAFIRENKEFTEIGNTQN